MRIISKFHDYYDACMKLGFDPKCIYKREEQEFEKERFFPAKIVLKEKLQASRPVGGKLSKLERGWYRDRTYEHGMIWFCGLIYPYVRFSNPVPGTPVTHEPVYCYNIEQLEENIKEFGSKEEKAIFNLKGKRNYFSGRKRRTQKELFNSFLSNNVVGIGFLKEEVVDILCKLGVPCLQLSVEGYESKLVLNPKLSNVQFYRAVDPYTAYQELFMFISGVMGGQAPPMVPISDEVRLEKHGFDRKWSFRKKVR